MCFILAILQIITVELFIDDFIFQKGDSSEGKLYNKI